MAFTTLNVFAHASYITDSVDIPMRSNNKIEIDPSNLLRMLPSDTKLQLLSTDSGWSQVEIDEQTGWVISRYLTSTKPARVKLKAQSQLIKALIIQNKKLRVKRESMTDKCKEVL
jgi:SH3 domain protein